MDVLSDKDLYRVIKTLNKNNWIFAQKSVLLYLCRNRRNEIKQYCMYVSSSTSRWSYYRVNGYDCEDEPDINSIYTGCEPWWFLFFVLLVGLALTWGVIKHMSAKVSREDLQKKSKEGVDRVKKEIWRFGEERMNLLLCWEVCRGDGRRRKRG